MFSQIQVFVKNDPHTFRISNSCSHIGHLPEPADSTDGPSTVHRVSGYASYH